MEKLTYFISDLHLGAAYIADRKAHEARVVSWLRSIAPSAGRLYLLGDVLDYWYEYRNVVPRGYIRFFGTLARLADSGVHIGWLTGNHDIWLFDYLRNEIGIEVVDAPWIERTFGPTTVLMAHGDRIGPSTLGFRIICKLFRNRLCQRLYSAVHPRLTVPFAHRWSRLSRDNGRDAAVSGHVDQIMASGRALLYAHPEAQCLIEGHYHLAINHMWEDGRRLMVLGDWIDKCTYAVFDGKAFTLNTFND